MNGKRFACYADMRAMDDRVRVAKETYGGRYSRPWVVYVDGRKLLDGRGGQRRFKTEVTARDAGVRKAAAGVDLPDGGHHG